MSRVRLYGTGASLGSFVFGGVAVVFGGLALMGLFGTVAAATLSGEPATIAPETLVIITGGAMGLVIMLLSALVIAAGWD